MNKITKIFKDNYFNEKFSLEYNIYTIFLIESFILATIAAIFNTITYSGFWFLFLQWVNIAFIVFVICAKPETRMKLKNIQILSNAFFYIPLIYFFTGGYNGTAFLFSTLAAYMLAISYSGVKRVIMIALQMVCYLGCIIISYLKPELVVPINSELSRVQDICITTAMAIGGMAIIATAVTRSFERKNDELSEVVLRDALTGAYNRRHLYENISEAINRDAQERQKSVVMMLDIDFFKKINDTYGHAAGDDTLIAFNNTVRKTLREQDVLVRYGGEEFVAILFNTDHTAGTRIAERVREAVCNIEYPLGYKTTVSIGVAVMHKDDTLDTALVRADSYLYEAKETGRNKVVSKDIEES